LAGAEQEGWPQPLVAEGIEAIVFRTLNDQPTLWDAILPTELFVLPIELARVDALLDDAVFFAPFAAYFDARIGRPSIPMETYLRLMFLKFRTGWAMRCCAGRWPIRFPGSGFAASRSARECRIRPR
jgi:hypothetical protein